MFRLEKIGVLRHVSSREVVESPLGLGFEKLDRDIFDPSVAYDFVEASGVKWIRIQSGWARTERERGVYDFAWLDDVVDHLVAAGCRPWICLCYGNGLYDANAARVFGATGCPPDVTEEQRFAWHRYVAATVSRYRGRVGHYEIWNEPDGGTWKRFDADGKIIPIFSTEERGREYGVFANATAKAIREGNPEAKVIVGSMCSPSLEWLTGVAATGCLADAWGFSYHCYTTDETENAERIRMLRAFLRRHNPAIRLIQGESGSQSRHDGHGALQFMAWTEDRQARELLRHTVSDLLGGVAFSSYFSCMDMAEALNGVVGNLSSYTDYGYFGVLSATFDATGKATGVSRPKPSYAALRNLAALFNGAPELRDAPVRIVHELPSPLAGNRPLPAARELTFGLFARPNGSKAFAYWKPCDLLTTSYAGFVSMDFADCPGVPLVADPLDGSMYRLPESMATRLGEGCWRLQELPLRDYPLFLLWGDFVGINHPTELP